MNFLAQNILMKVNSRANREDMNKVMKSVFLSTFFNAAESNCLISSENITGS